MNADEETRQRLREDFERTFFVEAGAGTGKTMIIVERIVNLVAAGRVRMEELAAITFTEAAAAELRDRVREGLERGAVERGTEAERGACRRAVAEIDLAAIQTIHAFAGNLLRSYPLEAGLPPGFATLDEVEQRLAFDERFRAWFWGPALEGPVREVLRRGLLLGLTQGHLRELAWALDGQHDLITPSTRWEAPAVSDAVSVAHGVGRRLTGLLEWVGYADQREGDPLAQIVIRAQPGAERLLAAVSEEEALRALRDLEGVRTNVGNQKQWGRLGDGRNACTAIKDELKEVKAEIAAALEGHRGAVLAGVLAALRDFVLENVAQRKREGVATFQDLLAWTRDLLRDNAEVRRRAQRRYRRIFVDEFQDTDPLQAEIVFYLAAEPEAALPDDWRDVRPVPGKLFVVGDPKQSIYRFRRADIAVYDGLLRRLAEARAQLVQNFRSVRPVIEWANHHFGEQMMECEGVQPSYFPLAASWEGFEDGVRCGVYRVGGDRGAEARALAGVVRTLVGAAQVSEPGPGGTRRLRAARYRDVCILMRSRTHLRVLERSLEQAGVPYRVESGSLMLRTQEVRDLLACLRAIEDPSDQVALVGALRAPAYGCSDPDLLRWVEAGGRLSYEEPGEGPDGPVKAALASLAGFHRQRHVLSPSALIEAFVRDRLLVAAAFDEPRPREAWRRLRYVVSKARSFTAAGRHSLRAFLDWIDDLEGAEVREAESAEAEPDEDAARILTIHKAKGLEFPIVLLAGLGSAGGGSNSAVEVIADRATGRLECRVGTVWRTAGFEVARERERGLEAAEAVRLLYVAATRARDHLVLSLYRNGRGGKSAASVIDGWLAEFAGECFRLDEEVGTGSWAERGQRVAGPEDGIGGWSLEGEREWLAERRALVERLSAPASVAVVQGEEESEGAGEEAEPTDLAEARRVWRRVPLLATVDGVLVDVMIDVVYETGEGMALVFDAGAGGEAVSRPELVARAFAEVTGRLVRGVEVVRVGGGAVELP